MARDVLSLALKITGDASGLRLTPVERALKSLDEQTKSITGSFDKFGAGSAAAARAQEQFGNQLTELQASLKAGQITAQEFAAQFDQIRQAATAETAALERAAQITEQNRTATERFDIAQAELKAQLDAGRISTETYNRAVEKLATGLTEAERASRGLGESAAATAAADAASAAALEQAEKARAAVLAEGLRVTQQYATAEERRAVEIARLDSLLASAAISEETYGRAVAEVSGANAAIAETERARQATLDEGQRLTEQLRTVEERRAAELERIDGLLTAGAISEETAARARAQASGETARAAEAERAALADLNRLQSEASAITEKYRTEAERRADTIAKLDAAIEAGRISEETYRRAIEDVTGVTAAAAKAESDRAAMLAEGQRLAQQFQTVEEKRAAELERIDALLQAGAITEETAARARAEASGANAAAAAAEKQRADALAEASRIIQANLTPQERYDQQIVELRGHLEAGRLSQEQFNRAAKQAADDLAKAGGEVNKTDRNIESLTSNVRILSAIEIGRVLVDGLQLIGNAFNRVTSQLASLASSVNSSLDRLNDFSARTGIGVEALQGYSIAAKLAGIDTEQFGAAIQRLAVNIVKATPGDQLDKSLRAINLSVAELRSLSPEDQFSAIGAAISELPTAADRAAAAVEIFGKQGAALAPLFREGAASIEELQARAERLGIIVSETQVNNVADMNDAFDLVRATIEGIIGQVIGNLAPAVTDVTNQFLKFVEEWSGSQGTGGTGIANAITDVLLQGAEYFVKIFDKFVGNFQGFSVSLAATGSVFAVVGNLIQGVSETLRVVFNVFESIGNALLLGLGKFLEGVGSWVSDDLEVAGKAIADDARKAIAANEEQAQQAAKNAANAFNAAFGGGASGAEQNAQSAAEQYLAKLRQEIENARLPEVQIQTNIDQTRDQFDAFFNGIVDQGSAVTEAYREFEAVVASAGDLATATADEVKAIEDAQKQVNQAIAQEREERQAALDAATKQAEADQKRIDGLLKTNDATAKIEEDLAAVTREIERAAEAQAAARDAGDQAAAGAAAARIAELDQLQAKLEEQQQALEQGFAGGFQAAFDSVGTTIDGLRDKAIALGTEASASWLAFSFDVAELQQKVKDGLLTKEAYDAEVARRRKIYDDEIANIERVAKEREEINKYVDQQLALQRFDGDQGRLAASQRVLEIEKEIVRVQEELAAAREKGNKEEADAASRRLQKLDQVKAKEQDIASGRGKFEEDIRKQQESALQSYQQQQQQAQQAYAQEQARIFEEQQKAAAAQAKRQEERLAKLNTLGSGTVKTSDVRTAEGAALVLDLAANAQDPRLIQERLQTKLLERIAVGIAGAAANYFNTPVSIVGAARLG